MDFWVIVLSYWVHLLSTVVWLGGITVMVLVALPALRQNTLSANQWLQLQMRFLPWANGCLVLLLVTGFVQMTTDSNYNGFLAIDSLWAFAMLVKHIAFVGMAGIGVYLQSWLYPTMNRLALLAEKKATLGEEEKKKVWQQEVWLLRLNLVCAVAVLFCTALATAI